MSEPQYEEEVSNPYNARKPWHTPDVPRRGYEWIVLRRARTGYPRRGP